MTAGLSDLRRLPGVPFLALCAALVTASDSVAQEAGAGIRGQGTEDRHWIADVLPDPTPSERYEISIERDVRVAMRDGVRLDGRLFLPDLPGDEPPPCVLAIDGYGMEPGDGYEQTSAALARRGFAVANFSYRGVGESEGERGLYHEYGRDGYDIVEWMSAQEWCDGNVGMFGGSLRGLNQWQVAMEAPPGLKAIAPSVACGNCYEYLWYPGGMLPGPGRERGRHPAEWENALRHRDFDDWWRDRSTTAEDHEAMAANGIAIQAVGGWKDYISAGNVQAFREFAAAGGEGTLMMHPEGHTGAGAVTHPYEYDVQLVLFFDRHLRGEDHGVVYPGDALIYVMGAEQWRWEETWPIPDTRWETVYLRAERSGTIGSLNDGSATAGPPAADEASVSYEYDPEDGPFLRTLRGSGTPYLTQEDQRRYESEALTWTTGALQAPTEVTGRFVLEFWASATAEDTDFVLQVSDVAPDGTSTYLTSGYLNAPRNESRSHPRPLVPGEIRRYHLDTQPTSYVFGKGHRIRFTLAGGTVEPPDIGGLPQGPGKNPNPASVTIYQDAEHPSAVEVPVIGGV